MSTEICGIPRVVFEKRGYTDEEVESARKGYNLYQQLLTYKNTHSIVICECGTSRSYTDRYRCRKTKKHKFLVSVYKSMQHS